MLDIINISKTFEAGSINEKKAIENLSLSLNKGDFVTVIGANGAGKSTLMNIIGGSMTADAGKIVLDGKDVTLMPEHKRAKSIGRLFQDPRMGTCPGMSIEENLAMAAKRGGWFSFIKHSDREFFREKLKALDMGLEDRLSSPVGFLSGGQRQAITLMMATIVPPSLLLLDEHTAALDPAAEEKVLRITDSVVSKNELTCMMITHNMESALCHGNRTIMLDRGQIILDISGDERRRITVQNLLDTFRSASGRKLDNDRMLLI